MAKAFTFLLFTSFTLNCLAGEVARNSGATRTSSAAGTSQAAVELGGCKPQVDATTNTEEAFARSEAEKAGLSKEELLARLIYSEALSTGYWKKGCNANSEDAIMENIGWGIMNRVKKKANSSLDPYSDVIFGKSQFRTSFSGKKANPFAEAFLCPLKSQIYLGQAPEKPTASAVYKKSQAIANNIVAEYEKSGIPKDYKGITNFFYPHSEFFGEMRPSWAKEKDATKNKGYLNILKVAEKPCVETYRLK